MRYGTMKDEVTGLNIEIVRSFDFEFSRRELTINSEGEFLPRNPDAHLGAEEKPFPPVTIRHYGKNAHWSKAK